MNQGWVYFVCEGCNCLWKESSRDCFSPSSSICPDCHEVAHPFHNKFDPAIPVDGLGNLLTRQIVKLDS